MRWILSLLLIVTLSIVTCSCSHSNDSVPDSAEDRRASANVEMPEEAKERASNISLVSELIAAQEFEDAGEIVDEEISNPLYGGVMHEFKARLLQLQNESEAALAKFMELLNQEHGPYDPPIHVLKYPFDLAVDLESSEELDQIATEMLARSSEKYSSHDCLEVPRSAGNSNDRLAYAFLVRGMVSAWEGAKAEVVAHCLSAKSLRPNDPVVMIHLAVAYRDRGNTGDRDLSRAQLSAAWNAASQNSPIRTAAQDFAYLFGMGQLP